MSRLETRDLARLAVRYEGSPIVQESLLYALYVLHRMHLAFALVNAEAAADREWGELMRLHVDSGWVV